MEVKCRSTWPSKCHHTLTDVTSCSGGAAQSLFPRPRPRPAQRGELLPGGQPGASSSPYTVRGRMIFIPGVSMGTKSMDCCWWRGACGSVFPINTQSWQRGSRMPARKRERPHHLTRGPSDLLKHTVLAQGSRSQ